MNWYASLLPFYFQFENISNIFLIVSINKSNHKYKYIFGIDFFWFCCLKCGGHTAEQFPCLRLVHIFKYKNSTSNGWPRFFRQILLIISYKCMAFCAAFNKKILNTLLTIEFQIPSTPTFLYSDFLGCDRLDFFF